MVGPVLCGTVTGQDSRGEPASRHGRDGGGYRGEDRRGIGGVRAALGAPGAPRSDRLLLGAPLLALAVALLGAAQPPLIRALDGGLHTVAGVLTAAAAVLAVVRFWFTGHANAAVLASALAGLAFLQALWTGLDATVATSEPPWAVARVAGSAVVAGALLDAVRAPVVDVAYRPWRMLLWVVAAAGIAAAAGALVAAGSRLGAAPVMVSAWVAVAALLGATAVVCEQRARPRRQGTGGVDWLAAGIGTLALAAAAEALAAGTGGAWVLVARVLTATAASVAVIGGTRDLRAAFAAQRRQLLSSLVEREVVEAVLGEESAQQRKRTHDVRSALTGIGGATSTLERFRDRLDDDQRARLQEAVKTEITRLQRLVEPAAPHPDETFSAAEIVATLSIGLEGPLRQEVPPDLRARGDRADVAAALRHLVDALHRRDPVTPVLVRASMADGAMVFDVNRLRDGAAAAPGAAEVDRLAVLAARRLTEASGGHVGAEREDGRVRYRVALPPAGDRGPVGTTRGPTTT